MILCATCQIHTPAEAKGGKLKEKLPNRRGDEKKALSCRSGHAEEVIYDVSNTITRAIHEQGVDQPNFCFFSLHRPSFCLFLWD